MWKTQQRFIRQVDPLQHPWKIVFPLTTLQATTLLSWNTPLTASIKNIMTLWASLTNWSAYFWAFGLYLIGQFRKSQETGGVQGKRWSKGPGTRTEPGPLLECQPQNMGCPLDRVVQHHWYHQWEAVHYFCGLIILQCIKKECINLPYCHEVPVCICKNFPPVKIAISSHYVYNFS